MLARPRGTSILNRNTRASYIALCRSMRARGVILSMRDQYFRYGSYIAGTCEYLEWEHTYVICSPI